MAHATIPLCETAVVPAMGDVLNAVLTYYFVLQAKNEFLDSYYERVVAKQYDPESQEIQQWNRLGSEYNDGWVFCESL